MGLIDLVCKCPDKISFSFGGGCCGSKKEDPDNDPTSPAPPTPPGSPDAAAGPATASGSIVFMYNDSLTIVGPGSMGNARIADEDEPVEEWDTMVLDLPGKRVVSLSGTIFGTMCDAAGGGCIGQPITDVFGVSFVSVLTAALELLTAEGDELASIQFNCLYRTKPVTILVYANMGSDRKAVAATVVCRPTHYSAPDLQKILAMAAGGGGRTQSTVI